MRSFLIKLAIGVGGVVLLVKLGSIDLAVLAGAADRPGPLALALACLLATVPLAGLRWWCLLKGLGFVVGLGWSLNATLISLFFHTFLPGAYGGDVVRLGLAYRATGGGLNRLTFSVLIDRITGLVALLLLGFLMVPALPEAYANRLEWVAGIAFGTGIAGTVVALLWGDRLAWLVGRLPAPVGPTLAYIVSEVVRALRAYVARPFIIASAIVLSLIQYLFVLSALVLIGQAMQFDALPLAGYIVAGIWSLVANALPITPGGLGVGEAAFAHVALAFASPEAAGASFGTVFLAMRMLSIAIGVIGVLPWLLNRVDIKDGIGAIRTGAVPDAKVPVPN